MPKPNARWRPTPRATANAKASGSVMLNIPLPVLTVDQFDLHQALGVEIPVAVGLALFESKRSKPVSEPTQAFLKVDRLGWITAVSATASQTRQLNQ